MLALHEPVGTNRSCGPVGLAILTGRTTDACLKALAAVGTVVEDPHAIVGVTAAEFVAAAKSLDIRLQRCARGMSGQPLADAVDLAEGVYVAALTTPRSEHVVIIWSDGGDRVFCRDAAGLSPIESHPSAAAPIAAVWRASTPWVAAPPRRLSERPVVATRVDRHRQWQDRLDVEWSERAVALRAGDDVPMAMPENRRRWTVERDDIGRALALRDAQTQRRLSLERDARGYVVGILDDRP